LLFWIRSRSFEVIQTLDRVYGTYTSREALVQRQEAALQGFGTRHLKSNNSNGANKNYRFD